MQQWFFQSLLLWRTCTWGFQRTGTQFCPSKAPTLEARHQNVDYTCCIMKKGTMEGLLRHLNCMRLSIKSIILKWRRMESSPLILETLLQRRDDSSLDVTIYRKLTHTQTDTWNSGHIIHPMSREDWSGVCMTERGASPPGRTTCRRKSATLPKS